MNENTNQNGLSSVSTIASTSTNFNEVMEELNGGVFLQQVGRALSDVAMGVVINGDKSKKGKVTITFDMVRIGESSQVAVKHTLSYSKPTARGKTSEEAATDTPLYVGRGGRLTVMPDNQTALDFPQN